MCNHNDQRDLSIQPCEMILANISVITNIVLFKQTVITCELSAAHKCHHKYSRPPIPMGRRGVRLLPPLSDEEGNILETLEVEIGVFF